MLRFSVALLALSLVFSPDFVQGQGCDSQSAANCENAGCCCVDLGCETCVSCAPTTDPTVSPTTASPTSPTESPTVAEDEGCICTNSSSSSSSISISDSISNSSSLSLSNSSSLSLSDSLSDSSEISCVCYNSSSSSVSSESLSESIIVIEESEESTSFDAGDAAPGTVDQFISNQEQNDDNAADTQTEESVTYKINVDLSDDTLMKIWIMFALLILSNMICCCLCQKGKFCAKKQVYMGQEADEIP